MNTADQSVAERPDYKQKRGELRVYLGAAPGVGKTYAMLGEARRRRERGTDVVAAVIETHGRKETADLLEGIEMVPPKYIEYRGSRFPELDVQAVLARRHVRLDDAGQRALVGDGQRAVAERMGLRHQLARVRGAALEGEIRQAVQLGIAGRLTHCRAHCHRPCR
jgi:hypothetical protein